MPIKISEPPVEADTNITIRKPKPKRVVDEDGTVRKNK
jgi:hypothetical protein